MSKPVKYYAVEQTRDASPPDYTRVVRGLSDEELEDEILGGKGEPGYRLALVTEHERRARADAYEKQERLDG